MEFYHLKYTYLIKKKTEENANFYSMISKNLLKITTLLKLIKSGFIIIHNNKKFI